MNENQILAVLTAQSRIGRRVILLLSYISEHGPTPRRKLVMSLPGGLCGEIVVALRERYIYEEEGVMHLQPYGKDVVGWLLGEAKEPKHWAVWEAPARTKQKISAVRRAITLKRITRTSHHLHP